MARKERIRVVFDTNLFITRLLRRKKNSINQRVFNLWLMRRRLQLIISRPILDEYLGTLENAWSYTAESHPLRELFFDCEDREPG